MSDEKDKLNIHGERQPTVDEILAEFSAKVRPFPTPEQRGVPRPDPGDEDDEEEEPEEEEPEEPGDSEDEPADGGKSARAENGGASAGDKPGAEQTGEKKAGEVIDLPPENPIFELTGRLDALIRKADEYADNMYDQAEPTPEELKAEQYIPGVDAEKPTAPPRKIPKPKRQRPAAPPPEDLSPGELAGEYKNGLKSAGHRLKLCVVLCVALGALSLNLPIPQLSVFAVRCYAAAGALAAVCALCWDVFTRGFGDALRGTVTVDTLAALAGLFTLLDTVTMPLLGSRGDNMPAACAAALVLTFALLGWRLKRQGGRISCYTASKVRNPYIVTSDDAKWSGRPAYVKWSGDGAGFGRQMQEEDGAQLVWRYAGPLLLLLCVLCSLISSVGHGQPKQILWCLSVTLTAAASCAAPLVYALPFKKLSVRLSKVGAAVAGWVGADRCSSAGIVLTDIDLFPPGTVKLNGIKVFGDFPNETVVAYAATLIRDAGSGLDKPFHDLLRAQGAIYRTATGVRFHEGGITGIIRNHDVVVGTAAFMHLMEVELPQGLNVKNAVFCGIDGDLAGIFVLDYDMGGTTAPSLFSLMRNRISPVLATRDPNLIPAFLGQKFKLPVDKMEFPPVDRRLELSDDHQEHSQFPSAILSREGLMPFSEAVVGAKRLRSGVRTSAVLAMLGAAAGVLLTFYLTFVSAYSSLTAVNFALFLLLWLVPELLSADWVTRY